MKTDFVEQMISPEDLERMIDEFKVAALGMPIYSIMMGVASKKKTMVAMHGSNKDIGGLAFRIINEVADEKAYDMIIDRLKGLKAEAMLREMEGSNTVNET